MATAGLVLVFLIAIVGCGSDTTSPVQRETPDPTRVPVLSNEWTAVQVNDSTLGLPESACIGPNGNLWVSEWLSRAIYEYDPQGDIVDRWYVEDRGDTLSPDHVVFAHGCYYVVAENTIHVFDRYRHPLRSWPERYTTGGEYAFASLGVDNDGDVYKVEIDRELVVKYARNGEFLQEWSTRADGLTDASRPLGIAVGPEGRVFVSDALHHMVLKFSPSGVLLRQFGSKGTGPGQFRVPQGLAFDNQGFLYVVDEINQRVQKFTRDGVYLAQFESRIPIVNEWDPTPYGIGIGQSNVYVVHIMSYRIRRFVFR